MLSDFVTVVVELPSRFEIAMEDTEQTSEWFTVGSVKVA